jgi:hypothetical protein
MDRDRHFLLLIIECLNDWIVESTRICDRQSFNGKRVLLSFMAATFNP